MNSTQQHLEAEHRPVARLPHPPGHQPQRRGEDRRAAAGAGSSPLISTPPTSATTAETVKISASTAETTAADRDRGRPLALGRAAPGPRAPRRCAASERWPSAPGRSRRGGSVRGAAGPAPRQRARRGGFRRQLIAACASGARRACARGCPSARRASTRPDRPRPTSALARRAPGSAASRIARTTQTRAAPAATTSPTLPASMPPIANQGSVAISAAVLDQLEAGRGPPLLGRGLPDRADADVVDGLGRGRPRSARGCGSRAR